MLENKRFVCVGQIYIWSSRGLQATHPAMKTLIYLCYQWGWAT